MRSRSGFIISRCATSNVFGPFRAQWENYAVEAGASKVPHWETSRRRKVPGG